MKVSNNDQNVAQFNGTGASTLRMSPSGTASNMTVELSRYLENREDSIVFLNQQAIVLMGQARYMEAEQLLQIALDRIEPDADEMDEDDSEDEDDYDEEDEDEVFNFTLDAVPLTPPQDVCLQETVRAFSLYERALSVVPKPATSFQERNRRSMQTSSNNQDNDSDDSTVSIIRSGSSASTAVLTDAEILSSSPNCLLLASAFFYNKALCHHLQGLLSGRDAHFEEALLTYNIAWGILSDFSTLTASKLLVELALMNNKGHVHYHLIDLSETDSCLDRMETLLSEYKQDFQQNFSHPYGSPMTQSSFYFSKVPAFLVHFAQNLIHNRQQLTTRLPPVA